MANVNAYNNKTLGTGVAQGNGSTDYVFSMDSYNFWTVQIEDTSGGAGTNTYKVYGSLDGTSYQDVASSLFGVASFTGDNMLIVDTSCAFRYVKVNVTRTSDGGAKDGAWTIFVKRSA